ncbi:MAG: DUF429 domain-containing protein [Candidatus Manganitrophus sp. SB1]|nr:DUF429 domain-containing protein [Candidatus Manganitrophus morganii]
MAVEKEIIHSKGALPTLDSILPRTFVHVPGIGPIKEKSLWKDGITSWQQYLNLSRQMEFSFRLPNTTYDLIAQSEEALKKEDAEFFRDHLPREEWWRLFPHFESRTVFLDIETTGLSHYYDEITLLGLYGGESNKMRVFLSGHNLDQISDILSRYSIVVTFNGTLFDLPFLKTKFPSLRLPPIHLDLRYILKRLGYAGGLKQIEETLGLQRSKKISSIDGLGATVLWARYVRGEIQALEHLIRYNAADITSLQTLLRFSYKQLAARLLNGASSQPFQPRLQRPKKVYIQVKRVNGSRVQIVVDRVKTLLKFKKIEKPLITVNDLLKKISGSKNLMPRAIGIDLRASEIRPTGWALLDGNTADTKLVRTDEQIITETVRYHPDIISIDSPLSLPTGRCCTKDSCKCREKGILRECERTLWRRGVRVFPCLLPSMQGLTERGIRLAEKFRKLGYNVIESYPGAAQDIMRIPRKKLSLGDLGLGLSAFGIEGDFLSKEASHDELDAITSAVVGYFYLSGDYEALGNDSEEYLIIPKLDRSLSQ